MSAAAEKPEGVIVAVEIHPADYRHLEQAAGAMRTDIADFAALAIYRQSLATINEMGIMREAMPC